jgi:hypothetical protein
MLRDHVARIGQENEKSTLVSVTARKDNHEVRCALYIAIL